MINEGSMNGLVPESLPEGLECLGGFDGYGFAKAKKDGFWGYVDRNLGWVVPPMFDEVKGSYAGDRTLVKKDLKWEFLGRLRSGTSAATPGICDGLDSGLLGVPKTALIRLAA